MTERTLRRPELATAGAVALFAITVLSGQPSERAAILRRNHVK